MAKLKTGRHTSALKENRKAHKRQIRNKAVLSKNKNIVKKVEDAVTAKDKTLSGSLLKTACSEWDKAAKRNIVHDNAASNQKARLSKLVRSVA